MCGPAKMEHSSSTVQLFPLLDPSMEAELLEQPWPMQEKNFQSPTPSETVIPSVWEENYQDLSDWCCVDPQSISRFPIPPVSRDHQDYHIGEEIKSTNSGVKDNYVNLSNIKTESKDITGISENWTVDNLIEATGMSFDGGLPIGQDQFNTVTDISDIWMDLLPTTSSIDELQAIDSIKVISNRNENVTDTSLDLISENIDAWFPIIPTDTDNISLNHSITNIESDDVIINNYQLNSTEDKPDTKQILKDVPLPADVESDSFNLLSYVCGESNLLDNKRNTQLRTMSTTSKPSGVENITEKNKIRREKKISQVRAKVEPYVPPLRINLKARNSSADKQKASKQIDEENGNYSESDSDAHTSDYSYRELREKNNKASRKSRINKKVKETEMMKMANCLEKDNMVLKMRVEELEKLVTSMRSALLQSALKKEK